LASSPTTQTRPLPPPPPARLAYLFRGVFSINRPAILAVALAAQPGWKVAHRGEAVAHPGIDGIELFLGEI
jgi:hypothetical protein